MVTITNSSVRSNIFETVYDVLTNANLLNGDVTVTAAYIDSADAFPQVVIHPVNVSKENWSFDRSGVRNNCEVLIDVWTKKNKNIDLISDEIDSLTSLKTVQGLMLVDWDESNAVDPYNQNKIHLKTITLGYARR